MSDTANQRTITNNVNIIELAINKNNIKVVSINKVMNEKSYEEILTIRIFNKDIILKIK